MEAALVPIVASAILFDLNLVTGQGTPRSLMTGTPPPRLASADPVGEGTVGAGTGATVGKILGPERAVKGGIGSAALTMPDGNRVAALVAVNAVGDVMDHRTGQLLAGPRRTNRPGMESAVRSLLQVDEGATDPAPPMSNTTIGVVATDATLTKEESNWLARVSHDGLALAIRPCHTPRDGDTMFAMATNHRHPPADLTALGAAAVEVTAQAIIRSIETATGLGGIPSISELEYDD